LLVTHRTMLPGHDGNSNVVYDESGTVYCYDRVSEPMMEERGRYRLWGREASIWRARSSSWRKRA